jgi:long-chain acyl-CoA synthetase
VLDEDGYLFIRGRADNAIIRGGFKVHPDDVVKILHQHPAIREAVVVGIPDSRLGQVPAAVIMLRDGAEQPGIEELRAFVKERALPYQVPVKFEFAEDVPRTTSMKPALPQVKAMFNKMA